MTNSLSSRLRSKLRKTTYLVQAAVLSVSAAVPILTNVGTAHGAQLTNRYIDISGGLGNAGGGTSEGDGRDSADTYGEDVTYTVTFDVTTAHSNIEGIVIDFCDSATGPITGTACTAPSGFDINESGLALANNTEISTLTINAASDTNTLILSNSTGNALSAAATVSFNLGTSAAGDGITNPDTNGTFYARILTYTTDTVANAYTSTVPGAYTDDGGIALAIANELTITARVQEQLQFCVGTAEVGTDCTGVSGTAVSLGVVDSSTVADTTAAPAYAMIRTNAANGATISYKAEQDTSSGKLKVTGATCTGTNVTDQCFNSAGTTQATITAGTESFGMAVIDINNSNGGGTNDNLTCDTNYDGDGTCDGTIGALQYAWDDTGVFDTIASSSASSTKVLDDELMIMRFAATASATTPTGLYSTTANFVATATF